LKGGDEAANVLKNTDIGEAEKQIPRAGA